MAESAVDARTWMERAQTDTSLRDFIIAEVARAGIRLDTLEYQNEYLRRNVATLTTQLEQAHRSIKILRNKLRKDQKRFAGNE